MSLLFIHSKMSWALGQDLASTIKFIRPQVTKPLSIRIVKRKRFMVCCNLLTVMKAATSSPESNTIVCCYTPPNCHPRVRAWLSSLTAAPKKKEKVLLLVNSFSPRKRKIKLRLDHCWSKLELSAATLPNSFLRSVNLTPKKLYSTAVRRHYLAAAITTAVYELKKMLGLYWGSPSENPVCCSHTAPKQRNSSVIHEKLQSCSKIIIKKWNLVGYL